MVNLLSKLKNQIGDVPTTVRWLMVISVGVRLILLAVAPVTNPLAYEQVIMARNVVNGHGFDMAWPYDSHDPERLALWKADPTPHPSAFMPPFVPAVNTVMFLVFGSDSTGIHSILILQCLVGAFIPLMVYRVGRLLGSEQQAIVASSVSLVYLPGLLTSATPAGAIWYGLMGLVVLYLALRIDANPSLAWLLGGTMGLLALMRSEFLAIGCLLACLPLRHRRWGVTARILIMMVTVVSPWLVRNALAFGQPVGIISHPWREMWRGANLKATGSSYTTEGQDIWEGETMPHVVHRLDSVPLTRTFELQADAMFKDEVLAYIRADPTRWLALCGKKVAMLWTIDPYYPKAKTAVYIVPTLLTSGLILAGLFVAIRRRIPILPLAIIVVCLSGLFAITYVLPRYQTYVFTIAMPLIACLPLPTFVASRLPRTREP